LGGNYFERKPFLSCIANGKSLNIVGNLMKYLGFWIMLLSLKAENVFNKGLTGITA
jgi:hypothetical protein